VNCGLDSEAFKKLEGQLEDLCSSSNVEVGAPAAPNSRMLRVGVGRSKKVTLEFGRAPCITKL
jgi:hypothetical protein